MTSLGADNKEDNSVGGPSSSGLLGASGMSHLFPVKPPYNPYIQS